MTWSPRIHDLTRPLSHDTLVALAGKLAASDGPVQDLEFVWLRSWERGDNGAQCQWTLNDHFGTHLDAPSHIVRGAPSVDQLDLGRLFALCIVPMQTIQLLGGADGRGADWCGADWCGADG